jgi:8-oxo-dGTP pyrophosphatase MutT (NUDIX family)
MMAVERSVGAIVFNRAMGEPHFLLLHYGAGHWDFPKGHPEGGETERQAMLRELREETGIAVGHVRVVPSFREKIRFFYRLGGTTVLKEVVFFLVESAERKVTLSFEHKGFRWLPLAEAVELATFKTAKQLLQKASAFLNQRSLGDFV